MKYARKLPLDIPEAVYKLRRDTRVVAKDGTKEAGEIFRHYVTRSDTPLILNLFPKEIAAAVIGVTVSNIGAVDVHAHTREECVINLYLQASGAKTVFYEGAVIPAISYSGGYFTPDIAHLTDVESFKAASGDVWVLNSRQPHSVIAEDSFEDRWAVQVYLSTPFHEVVGLLCNP